MREMQATGDCSLQNDLVHYFIVKRELEIGVEKGREREKAGRGGAGGGGWGAWSVN